MAFSPPNFNLICNLWRLPNAYPAAPDQVLVCQLYFSSRGLFDVTPGSPTAWVPPLFLRLPALTDIRPDDQIECPDATARLYNVRWVDDVHKGMVNEYRVGVLEQTSQTFPLP